MAVRAIRGAVTAENTKESIHKAAQEMIEEIIKRNEINEEDMIDIMFTMTADLDAAFPAAAVRAAGITNVPLIDLQESRVLHSLEKCIRVMVHINTDKSNADMKHVYLGGAKALRPDLAE